MAFLRHPCMLTAEGVICILAGLAELKKSPEYKKMKASSEKNKAEQLELKRKRDSARLAVKRGKYDWDHYNTTELYYQYEQGVLQEEVEKAEAAYGERKLPGVAHYLGPRMGDASC